ncbi:MAG TPA: hypothetical protein VIP29_01950 [Nitrososphaeraceae archaeon]
MSVEQTLQKEIEESERWLNIEKDDSTYKRDLMKRIELINWVLENMKNPDIQICDHIESKMSEIILSINQTYSILEADELDSELRILDWIFYQVCSNEVANQVYQAPNLSTILNPKIVTAIASTIRRNINILVDFCILRFRLHPDL